jgi:hypothetical protein
MKILLAYVDPGLGSLIWQSIVAGIVGFFFYLRKTRRWIAGTIRGMFTREKIKRRDSDETA